MFPEGLYSTGHGDKANLPSYIYSSYLFFNVKGMKVVIVSELGTSWHIFQGIQSDPVYAINRPREKGRVEAESYCHAWKLPPLVHRFPMCLCFCLQLLEFAGQSFPPQSVSCSIPPTGYCQTNRPKSVSWKTCSMLPIRIGLTFPARYSKFL